MTTEFLSQTVCVRVGQKIPLQGGGCGLVVGRFQDKVLASVLDPAQDTKLIEAFPTELLHLTGVTIED